MLVEDGAAVMSYEEIADKLGAISKSTVKKWADGLVEKGIMEREQKGKRVGLKLAGEYMRVAVAPDMALVSSESTSSDSPAMVSLKKVFDGAEGLGGEVTITIGGCKVGKGK